MSKIAKALLIGAYGAIVFHCINLLITERYFETDVELKYVFSEARVSRKVVEEIAIHGTKLRTISFDFKRPTKFPTDLKFILTYNYISWNYSDGQEAFINAKCKYLNCYFTNDKAFLNDMRNFDAIIFSVKDDWLRHPVRRSPHQVYIFTDSESDSIEAAPICNPLFDNYFNWTWSNKPDADISWTDNIEIIDINGTVIGPKDDMKWIIPMERTSLWIRFGLSKKTKMAVWFTEDCSKIDASYNLMMEIDKKLRKYTSHGVDIFGPCSKNLCRGWRMDDCFPLLEEFYYFYFAFEASNDTKDGSEKLLHAVQHLAVPVVFGNADYSRYLPPGSYIDANKDSPDAVAQTMIALFKNKTRYLDYFRWHNYYEYQKSPKKFDLCTLCQLLNERRDHKVVKNFRKWWHPQHESICAKRLSNYETPINL